MFLIDGPYVSDFLKQTLEQQKLQVVKTHYAEQELQGYKINFLSEAEAIRLYDQNPNQQFYTNSENALDWILQNFPNSDLTKKIKSVKDKVQFRDILAEIHPSYYYRGCKYVDLSKLDVGEIPFPVILKPSVGFFSLGVQRIENEDHWEQYLLGLNQTSASYEDIYPRGVLDNTVFSIEAVIPGEEFAVDCFFDANGEVVILNMMQHLFASGDDVNDRVYITSGALITQHLGPVLAYLQRLGDLFDLKDFQAHIEIRIDGDEIGAIEVNPLRFGGWCSTADLARYAWDLNLYKAVVSGFEPDWKKLIQIDPDHVYALVVLNNSTGVDGAKITRFDYGALLDKVQEPLELRRTDFRKYPVFGFLMCRVPSNNMTELERLLHSDLSEYI